MKTKAKLNKPKVTKEIVWKFPCLARYIPESKELQCNDYMVLFSAPGVGTVVGVKKSNYINVGYHSTTWFIPYFKPIKKGTKVILTQN